MLAGCSGLWLHALLHAFSGWLIICPPPISAGLKRLSINGNRFAHLPPALTSASQLTCLTIQRD